MTDKMVVFRLLWLVLAFSILLTGLASAQTVTLTSSVEQDGRQAACPREVVTFTCVVTAETRLRWIAEPFINQSDPFEYSLIANPGEMMVDMSGQFRANITDATQNGGFADLTSELTVNISVPEAVNGTVVQCSGQFSTMMNRTLIIAVPPSPPQLPSYSVTEYHLNDFTVSVQWESPASDGGVGIIDIRYTVSTTDPQAELIGVLMTTLTLSYNEMHMVSTTASNCAGESTASVVTIYEIGCGPPTPPPRGSLGDFTSSQEGAVVTFQCSPGLVPSQQMMSVCMANGRWTPDPAELVCRDLADCGDPSQPVNGDVMAPTSTVEGSIIVFQCSPGFIPSLQMMSVCAANGSWTPDPADLTCMPPPPGDCGVPESPTNGTVNYTTTTEGSQATFQCSAGLVPGEVMTAVCEDSGGVYRWNPDPGDLSCRMPSMGTSLSTAEAVAITLVLSSIVSFTAGLLVALVIAYCYIQRQQKTNQYSPSEPKQPAPMYEDVSMDVRRDIELKENVAYRVVGHDQ